MTTAYQVDFMMADGLLQSRHPQGPRENWFPLDTLGVLFPNLYPEEASSTCRFSLNLQKCAHVNQGSSHLQ